MKIKDLTIKDDVLTFISDYTHFENYPNQFPKHKAYLSHFLVVLYGIFFALGLVLFLYGLIKLNSLLIGLLLFIFPNIISLTIGWFLYYRPMTMTLKKNDQNNWQYDYQNYPLSQLNNGTQARVIMRVYFYQSTGRYKKGLIHHERIDYYVVQPMICLEIFNENQPIEFLRILSKTYFDIHQLRQEFDEVLEQLSPILNFLNLPLHTDKENVYWLDSEHKANWQLYQQTKVLDFRQLEPPSIFDALSPIDKVKRLNDFY